MVEAKPTPMPWELRGWSIKHPGNGFRICIVEQPDKALRRFGGGDYDDMMDECRANAELIARAPMLAHANVQQAEEIKALAARLAEAERLLKIVDDAARHADMGRYWVGLYYDECEAIRSFVRPADSAPAVRHTVKCRMFPDPFDERDPVGPCTCGAVSASGDQG